MSYITPFPLDPPLSTDPGTFDPRADSAWSHLSGTIIPEINALALLLSAAAAPPIAIPYVFSTTTTVADPGAGMVRLNNATQTSATALLADLVDGIGTTVTGLLDQFDDSTSTVKGYLRLTKAGDETKWLVFAVTAMASPSGYRNITVSSGVGSSSSPFADGDNVTLTFVRNGDKGDTGPASDLAPYFLAVEEGGVPSAAARVTRLLNTVYLNRGGWTFSSNQVTVPAGDYMAYAIVGGAGIGGHYAALRNVTDSTDLVTGVSGSALKVTDLNFFSHAFIPFMPFTLAATKTLRLDHLMTDPSGGILDSGGNNKTAMLAIYKRT